MAKVFALERGTAQPVTVDTVLASKTDLGSAIAGMQTTSLFPSRCVNLFTVFAGDPYLLVLSGIGDIEIHKLVSGTWTLVGGPFTPALGDTLTPICLHVVNNQLVALWDVVGVNDGITAVTSFDGSAWSSPDAALFAVGASSGGHSVVYRGAVWFTTAAGLWAYAPLARFITLAGIAGTFVEGETVTGSVSLTTAVVRSFNSPTLRVDTVSGSGFAPGDVISGPSGSGNFSSQTRFVNNTPDDGNDTFLGPAGPGTANLAGCFVSWDGVLHFLQPRTASNPTRIYRLASEWEPTAQVLVPQWTSTSFSGLVDVGLTAVLADSGLWCMFVNTNDELCVFYSGSGSTKLAKTSGKTLPLTFTDLTNSLLPTSIATKTYLGITSFVDDRRRATPVQAFFIRDLSGGSTLIATWDSVNSVTVVGSFVGTTLMYPASKVGHESTFTNLQPTVQITSIDQPFPGRVRIDYTLRSDPAYTLGIIPEYSLDGDSYFPMTPGDGDSGVDDLPATPGGDPYFFHWDVFSDLDGDLNHVLMRIVARITGV